MLPQLSVFPKWAMLRKCSMRGLPAFLLLVVLVACPAGAQEMADGSAQSDSLAFPGECCQPPAMADQQDNGLVEPHFGISTEYIFWWLREGRMPPSLTTSSPASAGLLGEPDTHTLYGGGRLETRHGDQFNGVRVAAAYW